MLIEPIWRCPKCNAEDRSSYVQWNPSTVHPARSDFLDVVLSRAKAGYQELYAGLDGKFCSACGGRGWVYHDEKIAYILTRDVASSETGPGRADNQGREIL